MLSLAGSLLAEISLPKLAIAWMLLIVAPGLMLGMAPIVASIWFNKVSSTAAYAVAEVWSAIILIALVGIGWFSFGRLFRFAESNFWALNSLLVQPIYATCREALRHLVERGLPGEATDLKRSNLRAITAVASGVVVCGLAVAVLMIAWPHAHFSLDIAILGEPTRMAVVALANGVVLVSAYVAAAALIWAVADATMDPPRDLEPAEAEGDPKPAWRVAHLSDLHIVGERYGFRIESGRAGPRGNERLGRILAKLEAIHAERPLHAILITGDMTDAGRSTEWAEFFDAIERRPNLLGLMLILPGNHDVNIIDRANPARFELPTSPNKRLRKVRALSAMEAIQGERVRTVERENRRLGVTLSEALAPFRGKMASFVDGKPWSRKALDAVWTGVFPMVMAPERDDGLGIILLNSNAETHFSFTNALGMISSEQARGVEIAAAQYPQAYWLIALHHHLVEYPQAATALSERIGTALINGNWFVRWLKRLSGRAALMHGHRHVDWIGECAGLPIVSAPSPIMGTTNEGATHFYVHTLTPGADRRLTLLKPQRVDLAGAPGDAFDVGGALAPPQG